MTYPSNSSTQEAVDVWQLKQQWMEKVMASDLSKATKIFAFGIFIHAYGNKTESFPGSEQIMKNTNISSSGRFPEYRRALEDAGAFTISKRRAGQFKQEHCVYELNLKWDGTTLGVTASDADRTSTPDPSGESNTPSSEGPVSLGKSSVSSEISNTSSNHQGTTKEDLKDVNVAEHDSVLDEISASPSLDVLEQDSVDVVEQAAAPNASGGLAAYQGVRWKQIKFESRHSDPHAWIRHHETMRFKEDYLAPLIALKEADFRPDLGGGEWIDAALLAAGYPLELMEEW